jgi:hypothetical protein
MTEVESTRLWVAAIVIGWVAMVSGLALERINQQESRPLPIQTPDPAPPPVQANSTLTEVLLTAAKAVLFILGTMEVLERLDTPITALHLAFETATALAAQLGPPSDTHPEC